jgi:hypothetical protein
MIHLGLMKSAILLALLRRQAESRERDLAIASVYTHVGIVYGPPTLPYLTFLSFIADDQRPLLAEIGYPTYEQEIGVLLRVARESITEKYEDADFQQSIQTTARQLLNELRAGQSDEPLINLDPGASS